MKKESRPKDFLQQPVYPGGPQAMRDFIKKNLQYPASAVPHKASGTVRLRINIDHTGKVSGAQVLTSVGHGCDEEAQRVAQLLRFHVPKQHKIRAIFHKTLNFHFKFEEKPAPAPVPVPDVPTVAAPTIQYTYTVTTNSDDPQKNDIKGKVVYGYKVNL